MMQATIQMIEDFSLNAWPSHQIQFYDGWLLRFSYFYTHRTNSVEQIGPSSIPLEEKIDFCEDAYRRWGTPAIFKITPLLPEDFEQRLIRRNYQVQHITQVMLLDYAGWFTQKPEVPVLLERTINDRWINGLFSLKEPPTPFTARSFLPCTGQYPKRPSPLLFPIPKGRSSPSAWEFWTEIISVSMPFMCIPATVEGGWPGPYAARFLTPETSADYPALIFR